MSHDDVQQTNAALMAEIEDIDSALSWYMIDGGRDDSVSNRIAVETLIRLRKRLSSPSSTAQPSVPSKEMVDRFLSWRLPEYFRPDCYVTFDAEKAKANRSWPVGTNLLTADQAKEMLAHVLAASPSTTAPNSTAEALITRLQRAHGLVLTDHSNDIEIRQTIDDAIAALSGKGTAL